MKIFSIVIFLTVFQSAFAKSYFSKAPFLTIRKFTDIDSTPVTTVTCTAKLKVEENLPNSWVRVSSSGRKGFVLSRLISGNNEACLAKKRRLLLNSVSLSAQEIYLWAKLGEHFIEGEINGF